MELWFYKAEHGDWKDRLIGWWTRGPYSHVEIAFSDGLCFSSSPRDGGCRFVKIDPSDHWDSLSLRQSMEDMTARFVQSRQAGISPTTITNIYERKIREWCETQVGKPYDWQAVLGFTFQEPAFEDREKWYCSEVVLYAFNHFGLWKGNCHLHPNQMYEEIVQISGKDAKHAYTKV